MKEKLIYIMYFWKYSTKELLEDILELSIDEISEYMVEMGKYFYEKEMSKFVVGWLWYQKIIKTINSRWYLEDKETILF